MITVYILKSMATYGSSQCACKNWKVTETGDIIIGVALSLTSDSCLFILLSVSLIKFLLASDLTS